MCLPTDIPIVAVANTPAAEVNAIPSFRVDDAHWQALVEQLIERAAILILLYSDPSTGIDIEIEAIRRCRKERHSLVVHGEPPGHRWATMLGAFIPRVDADARQNLDGFHNVVVTPHSSLAPSVRPTLAELVASRAGLLEGRLTFRRNEPCRTWSASCAPTMHGARLRGPGNG